MSEHENEETESKDIQEFERTEEGHVVLPVEQGQFEDFIKSLLGSPQTISNVKRGSFEVDRDDLKDIYQLITQRINQQNEGTLIEFNAKIVYDDDSTVSLNSLQELITYREVRSVVSKAVHLEWKFLVKFQDKNFPEKQNIKVSFLSSDTENMMIDSGPVLITGAAEEGIINYRIEHTARTWGADIEAMLTSHFESLIKSPSRVKELVRSFKNEISFAASSLFFLSALVISFITSTHFSNNRVEYVSNKLSNIDGGEIDVVISKINTLAEILSSGAWAQHFFAVFVFIIFSLIASLVLGSWVYSSADNPKPSFVLLTEESETHKENVLNEKSNKWWSFVFSIITTLVLGVLSNVIFQMLFSS